MSASCATSSSTGSANRKPSSNGIGAATVRQRHYFRDCRVFARPAVKVAATFRAVCSRSPPYFPAVSSAEITFNCTVCFPLASIFTSAALLSHFFKNAGSLYAPHSTSSHAYSL
jgi:hypothetical protein